MCVYTSKMYRRFVFSVLVLLLSLSDGEEISQILYEDLTPGYPSPKLHPLQDQVWISTRQKARSFSSYWSEIQVKKDLAFWNWRKTDDSSTLWTPAKHGRYDVAENFPSSGFFQPPRASMLTKTWWRGSTSPTRSFRATTQGRMSPILWSETWYLISSIVL